MRGASLPSDDSEPPDFNSILQYPGLTFQSTADGMRFCLAPPAPMPVQGRVWSPKV